MFKPRDRQKCAELFERYYAGRKFHAALYRDLIRKYLSPGLRLLDAGCGRYLKFSKELSDTAKVTGIDLESTLETDNQCRPFGVRGDLDRKSTRLNSSHRCISYAVFCLKKKK